jgi:hypothetical protein
MLNSTVRTFFASMSLSAAIPADPILVEDQRCQHGIRWDCFCPASAVMHVLHFVSTAGMTGADASKLIVRSACCFACPPRFAGFGDARFCSSGMMKKSGNESHQIS